MIQVPSAGLKSQRFSCAVIPKIAETSRIEKKRGGNISTRARVTLGENRVLGGNFFVCNICAPQREKLTSSCFSAENEVGRGKNQIVG